jgi:hypothetical protein
MNYMDMKWYIVYTKPGSEKKVSEILTRKKIENYSPLISVTGNWRENRKVQETSLFKGFVFVQTAEEQHEELKKINNVLNLVYWKGKPVLIKNLEIKVIKLFLNEYADVTLEKTVIKPGHANTYGNDQEMPLITIKNKKAIVNLPSIGYIMTAEVETTNVRIISAEGQFSNLNIIQNRLFNRVFELNNSLKNYWVKAFILSICVLLVSK